MRIAFSAAKQKILQFYGGKPLFSNDEKQGAVASSA
jgi:hypothetical protein